MTIPGLMNKVISCNVCQNNVEGMAFRTSCFHLLCPRCAQESFENDSKCPVCQKTLDQKDVNEMTLGIECQTDFLEMMMQNLFEQTNWSSICETHRNISNISSYVQTFLFTQLTIEASKENDIRNSHKQHAEMLRQQLASVKEESQMQTTNFIEQIENLQKNVRKLEHESIEMKQAYQEKSRKCTAWSKAYENLKNQINSLPKHGSSEKNLQINGPDDILEISNNTIQNSDIHNKTKLSLPSESHLNQVVKHNPGQGHQITSANMSGTSEPNGRNVRKRIETTTVRQTIVPVYNSNNYDPNIQKLNNFVDNSDFIDKRTYPSQSSASKGEYKENRDKSKAYIHHETYEQHPQQQPPPPFPHHYIQQNIQQVPTSRFQALNHPSNKQTNQLNPTPLKVSNTSNQYQQVSNPKSCQRFTNNDYTENQHTDTGENAHLMPGVTVNVSANLSSVASFRSKLLGFKANKTANPNNTNTHINADGGNNSHSPRQFRDHTNYDNYGSNSNTRERDNINNASSSFFRE